MRRGTGRAARTAGARAIQFSIQFLVGATAAFLLAGCANDAQPLLMQAQLRGPSIAFESIDGPPLPIFQRLVADLSTEAEQRHILVVSRAGQPAYRVRGYLAALMSHGKTHIGWVWDVYDAQKQRAFRIAGEEVFGKTGDAWALLDDPMLSRIARTSMDRLVAFLGAPDTAVADATPPPVVRAAFAQELESDF